MQTPMNWIELLAGKAKASRGDRQRWPKIRRCISNGRLMIFAFDVSMEIILQASDIGLFVDSDIVAISFLRIKVLHGAT